MNITDSALNAIYDAAYGQTAWIDALSAIARSLKAIGCTAGTYDVSKPYDWHHCDSTAGQEFIDTYFRDFAGDSPTLQALQITPISTIANADDLLGEAAFRQTRFYRSLMKPFGLGRIISANIAEPTSGTYTAAGLYRSENHPPFTAEDHRLFIHVMRHLDRAMRMRAMFSAAQATGELSLSALDAAQTGVLFVDRIGRLVGGNKMGENCLSAKILTTLDGHIQTSKPTETAALHRAIRWASGGRQEVTATPKISITRPDGGQMTVEVIPTVSWQNGSDATLPAVALLLRNVEPHKGTPWPTIQALFGLTPSEMKVAKALVDFDLPHSEIADTLGVSLNTFKTHRLHAYQKLGVDSHASLIRFVAEYANKS